MRNTAPCDAPWYRGGVGRFFSFALLLVVSSWVEAQTLFAEVVGVTDGDTVTVLDETKTQEKLRVAGIDALEKKQPFGEKSKQSLSEIVYGKRVRIEWSKRDRYGRIVGQIFVSGACGVAPCPEIDAGLVQVRRGLAWHYKKYMGEQSSEDQVAYAQAEERAREGRIGLWSEPDPIPPWEWRHPRK